MLKKPYRLLVVTGPARSVQFETDRPVLRLGRDESCDFVIPDTTVSRAHAEIRLSEEGIAIRDLESANGTWVNDESVGRGRVLRSGDRIELGDSQLLFTFEDDYAAPGTLSHDTRRSRGASIIGSAPAMDALRATIERLATTDAAVLILGESGSGKELVAKAIHASHAHSLGPLVTVNAPALPRSLVESELFGHERGAFTGAARRADGAFTRADGGTLFLDEIGELELAAQAKLLRVLENGTFHRVGGNEELRSTARVIAATNRDLEAEIEAGRFREDLYYRLRVLQVVVPPLRERKSDIPELVDYFVRVFGSRARPPVESIDDSALRALERYDWPGNVRQLKNSLRQAIVLAAKPVLARSDFDGLERSGDTERLRRSAVERARADGAIDEGDDSFEMSLNLEENERRLIRRSLEVARGNKTKAAELLGIARNTLYEKLKRLGIDD